ncbi:MAG: RelA/SpoT domain-containing protein [Ruminococcaceae bacterium]|nr:RelA/SpoT domain-containing protein [Oscillospiraceae bacterium]
MPIVSLTFFDVKNHFDTISVLKGDVGMGSSSDAKEKFLKKYKNIQLEKDFEIAEKRIPDFWKKLERIRNHYEESKDSYKQALSGIIDEISKKDMNIDNPVIHSIRYRIKDVDSLTVKIIKKCARLPEHPQNNPEIEKYREISEENYYQMITDLVGIRILIRYRYQWQDVHSLIWGIFDHSQYQDFEDWKNAYSADPAKKYIVEKPKAYIKQESDRSTYEAIGKNIFDIRDSDNHYASIHYIINRSGTLCEIQVRTIFDEAWCECNHDFVYKLNNKRNTDKNTLESLSKILSQHTTAAESIVSLMCDLAGHPSAQKKSSAKTSNDKNSKNNSSAKAHSDKNNSSETFLSVQKRVDQLLQTGSFIDRLLNGDKQ